MPWQETDALKQRVKFVLEWERMWKETEGRPNVAALCRAFAISRECGYKWIERFQAADHDVAAVVERSRRPLRSPTQVSPEMEDLLVRARKLRPHWGPHKLRAWLQQRSEHRELPAASTIGAVLKRNGLSRLRRRRQRTPPQTRPLADCDRANAVWCVDFKGQFRTGDGVTVYPLTLMDAYSRYLLRCEGLLRPDGMGVWEVFEGAFEEYGLPDAIRSDNGSPFASKGGGGLSKLSVWWIKLGIRPERIEPGHPEQNGRHERMHLTLKQETASPSRATVLAQQTPASLYVASARRLPKKLPRLEPDFCLEVRAIDALGRFQWGRSKVMVNVALRGELVGISPIGEHHWEVRYGPVLLGILDGRRPSQGLRAGGDKSSSWS